MVGKQSKILDNVTPELQTMTFSHDATAPKEIPTEDGKLHRVARPLRHVKYIPLKALVFTTKDSPLEFTYEKKIKTPISKNKLVVQVSSVGLNPIDMKIKNGYTNTLYGEIGLGREYCGVVADVGSELTSKWHTGDKVMGIYYHPHMGVGALQSSILVDPKDDIIAAQPKNISDDEAAGSLYCLGTAYNILSKLERNKHLRVDSNVLINGGTSSVGLFAIQLLKRHFKLNKRLVIVTSSNGPELLKEQFPDLDRQMIFINYLACRGKSSKPLRKMLKDEQIADYTDGSVVDNEVQLEYKQGKFDIVLDFVGGYDIISHSSSLIHAKGVYVTTVGDYVANYKEDIFNSWDNPSANARKMFGNVIWSFTYLHYHFDSNPKHATKNDWVAKCTDLLNDGTVKCVIDKVYDWRQAKEAFSYMQTQRAQGKIILKVEKF
ncbi:uncharacterized protein KNAG_0B02350 [Huiozyma naganishii CBS 8797]|uniref:Enoyl reductase (ER) domain-containing protein n=1 Tax=Huiozyma naganishii (strain ATCC MYA-139 / BCRC 22969 / CBS 8797 / KCTC 17520 / NBRC 10181 / NCYC 3082 / Yp74L-3) TaxID=1071383 RepID=J7RUX6_HUIN7|nr:hypothetical protein KNAG_0B02350 [Kazachstania naganishii CBS 8797]CCK68677.1 hypothetical protein KNAG_0B02350 [Kazachstania naganishii CBS 8797]